MCVILASVRAHPEVTPLFWKIAHHNVLYDTFFVILAMVDRTCPSRRDRVSDYLTGIKALFTHLKLAVSSILNTLGFLHGTKFAADPESLQGARTMKLRCRSRCFHRLSFGEMQARSPFQHGQSITRNHSETRRGPSVIFLR